MEEKLKKEVINLMEKLPDKTFRFHSINTTLHKYTLEGKKIYLEREGIDKFSLFDNDTLWKELLEKIKVQKEETEKLLLQIPNILNQLNQNPFNKKIGSTTKQETYVTLFLKKDPENIANVLVQANLPVGRLLEYYQACFVKYPKLMLDTISENKKFLHYLAGVEVKEDKTRDKEVKQLSIGIVKNLIDKDNDKKFFGRRKHKLDLNKPDDKNKTPLEIAVDKNNFWMVEALLKHPKTEPNKSSVKNKTLLEIAVDKNNVEMVRALLKHPKTEPNKSSVKNKTLLEIAVDKNNFWMVEALLKHPKTEPNKSSVKNKTLLEIAIENNNVEMVKALLKHPTTNIKESTEKEPGLSKVARQKLFELAGTDQGIQKCLYDYHDGKKLVDLIKSKKVDEFKKLFPETGLDVNIRFNIETESRISHTKNNTFLQIAVDENCLGIVDYLLESKQSADVDLADAYDRIPFCIATKHGYLTIVKKILDKYPTQLNKQYDAPNRKDTNRKITPLYLAVGNNRLDVTKYLVDQGADINEAVIHSTEYNDSLLAVAVDNYVQGLGANVENIIQYLIEKIPSEKLQDIKSKFTGKYQQKATLQDASEKLKKIYNLTIQEFGKRENKELVKDKWVKKHVKGASKEPEWKIKLEKINKTEALIKLCKELNDLLVNADMQAKLNKLREYLPQVNAMIAQKEAKIPHEEGLEKLLKLLEDDFKKLGMEEEEGKGEEERIRKEEENKFNKLKQEIIKLMVELDGRSYTVKVTEQNRSSFIYTTNNRDKIFKAQEGATTSKIELLKENSNIEELETLKTAIQRELEQEKKEREKGRQKNKPQISLELVKERKEQLKKLFNQDSERKKSAEKELGEERDEESEEEEQDLYSLHEAVREGKLEEVKRLAEQYYVADAQDAAKTEMRNWQINHKNTEGQTPLHLAFRWVFDDSTRVSKDASETEGDIHNEEAIKRADIIGILLRHGADMELKNKDEQTSWDLAQQIVNSKGDEGKGFLLHFVNRFETTRKIGQTRTKSDFNFEWFKEQGKKYQKFRNRVSVIYRKVTEETQKASAEKVENISAESTGIDSEPDWSDESKAEEYIINQAVGTVVKRKSQEFAGKTDLDDKLDFLGDIYKQEKRKTLIKRFNFALATSEGQGETVSEEKRRLFEEEISTFLMLLGNAQNDEERNNVISRCLGETTIPKKSYQKLFKFFLKKNLFSGVSSRSFTNKARLTLIKFLIESGEVDIDTENSDRNTALHVACKIKDKEIVKFLLDNEADVDIEGLNRNTPLHIATSEKKPDLVKELLEKGANANITNNENKIPFQIACEKMDWKSILVFFEQGFSEKGSIADARAHLTRWIPDETLKEQIKSILSQEIRQDEEETNEKKLPKPEIRTTVKGFIEQQLAKERKKKGSKEGEGNKGDGGRNPYENLKKWIPEDVINKAILPAGAQSGAPSSPAAPTEARGGVSGATGQAQKHQFGDNPKEDLECVIKALKAGMEKIWALKKTDLPITQQNQGLLLQGMTVANCQGITNPIGLEIKYLESFLRKAVREGLMEINYPEPNEKVFTRAGMTAGSRAEAMKNALQRACDEFLNNLEQLSKSTETNENKKNTLQMYGVVLLETLDNRIKFLKAENLPELNEEEKRLQILASNATTRAQLTSEQKASIEDFSEMDRVVRYNVEERLKEVATKEGKSLESVMTVEKIHALNNNLSEKFLREPYGPTLGFDGKAQTVELPNGDKVTEIRIEKASEGYPPTHPGKIGNRTIKAGDIITIEGDFMTGLSDLRNGRLNQQIKITPSKLESTRSIAG